ncbi:hypothetical protein [Deinococcus sonorensis]|uniref:Sucrose phosphatase-like domain-containing protein n=2 Tax=Deinococcus sonorensis TaxID=309891 RepID=A0AAU7UD08_9DEIO
MTRVVAFCDLDDTLFFTGRKLEEALRVRVATVDRSGEPHSYMNRAQVYLLDRLLEGATLIPVTGRDPDAYGRLQLQFDSWAILDHGATVLRPGGRPDQAWSTVMAEVLAEHTGALELAAQAARHISQLGNLDCEVRLHRVSGAEELPLMVVIKHPYALQSSLDSMAAQLREWLQETRIELRTFANGNNLTLIAPEVSKEAAVRYVLQDLQEQADAEAETLLTLGLGDSVADVPFMALCDFALTPGQSQLMRAVQEAELEQR